MTAENQILAILPTDVLDQLAPHLHRVSLPQGKVLYRAADRLTHLYFPLDCLISITTIMQNGAIAEVGMVGNRDVLGVHAFLSGYDIIQTEFVVQVAGNAMRIDARTMQQELEHSSSLRDVLLRYSHAFLAQVSQTAACNSLHTLEQRLPRWLLEVQSRIGANELPLTQEFIAMMLGVRRAGITQTAQKLQERKLIQYRRGNVRILNQAGLEASACECFQTVRAQYDRLLGESSKNNND